jgi:hypothetical protein
VCFILVCSIMSSNSDDESECQKANSTCAKPPACYCSKCLLSGIDKNLGLATKKLQHASEAYTMLSTKIKAKSTRKKNKTEKKKKRKAKDVVPDKSKGNDKDKDDKEKEDDGKDKGTASIDTAVGAT